MKQKAGRITAGGVTKEVSFEAVDGPINDRIDEAYRAKYHGSPYLKPMYELGADERIVQRVLRHAKAHVTKERYIKAFDPAVLAGR